MTRAVKTVHPEATIREVIVILSEANISGLPVVDDNGSLIGVISESDILHLPRKLYLPDYQYLETLYYDAFPDVFENEVRKSLNLKVGDLMTREVITVRENTAISDVMRLMLQHNINRLPVVRGQKLVGIITRSDLVNLLYSKFSSERK